MKLLIGIPSLDFVHVEFVKCLVNLQARLKDSGVAFDVFICSGTLAHVARDRVACKAINDGYTHVLWLDADMIFSPDILEDLQFSGKDFVTGIAVSRRPPYQYCVFKSLVFDREQNFQDNEIPNNTFQIGGCGFACVLITTQILKDVFRQYKTCFLPMKDLGEDLAFCKRATECGYTIWAEPSVQLGHIGHNAVWPEDHRRYMERLQQGE